MGYVAYLKILNRNYHSGFVLVTNICYTFTLLATFAVNVIDGSLLIELFVLAVGFFVIYLAQDNPESYLYKNINVWDYENLFILLEVLAWYILSEKNIRLRNYDLAYGILNNTIIRVEKENKTNDYIMMLLKYMYQFLK